jgi:flagellar export protein FliJ
MARAYAKRYTTLLNVRKRQEEVKGQALALVRREHAALRRQRRELEEHRRAVLSSAAVPRGAVIAPARLQSLYQYERHLGKLTDAKDAEIGLHAQRVQTARVELETAMARRRMMEKLIERVEYAERARANRREQRALDESSVVRFAHLRRQNAANWAEHDENPWTDIAGHRGVHRGGPGGAGGERGP